MTGKEDQRGKHRKGRKLSKEHVARGIASRKARRDKEHEERMERLRQQGYDV